MIDDLLSPARIEPLAPEPGGSEAAWDEIGRRRRTRTLRAQVAAGVGLVLIVMVGLLPSLDDRGRAAELDVAAPEANRRATIDRPSLLEDESDDTADESTGGVRAGGSAGGTPPASVAAPAPAPSRPGAPAPAPGRAKPPVERTRAESIYIGCLEWCLSAQALKEDDVYALRLELCVAVGARARRFSYATTQELDLWVTAAADEAKALWTWSLGQRFPVHEHHLDIGPGECVTWQTNWDGTDEGGQTLPAGNYRLFAKSLAEQVATNSTTETTFQIPD